MEEKKAEGSGSSSSSLSVVSSSVPVGPQQGFAGPVSSSSLISGNVTGSAEIPQSTAVPQPPKDPFGIAPPQLPTQQGPEGVLYDFNDGARVCLPQGGKWHVNIEDAESGNVLFGCDADGGWVVSTKKYYVPFNIKVWRQGEQKPLVDHTMNLEGKEVQVKFPIGTLGDIVGWMPYVEKFRQKHKCAVELIMAKELAEIFSPQYPQIFFTSPEHPVLPGQPIPPIKSKFQKPYASYKVGLFFRGNTDDQPIDFRQVGLHKTAGYILGVDPKEEAPRVSLNYPRKIKEPYVCIATKSSCQAKLWNNGAGWEIVVKHLKDMGYRVLCIDREPIIGHTFVWNRMPHDAENFTGSLPLAERLALLQHADFFVGLSSGLTWLAWCAKIPIVMISGFTLPICEFETPYRVYSSHGCKGCWDDVNCNFDHHDYFWCPRHKGTDRQYECSRLITGKQVIGHIDRLMGDHALLPPNKRK